MQDIESLQSIGDAAVIQSYLRNSLKGIVSSELELCTKALLDSLSGEETPRLPYNESIFKI